ncbi:MAG: hypothetical protein ACM3SY_06275 [Candidatus Omnitrophota bacterium]
MLSTNDTAKVRGKAIASIPKFVTKKFGSEGFEQWFDAISSEADQTYLFPIANDEWYPLKELLIEPSIVISRLFYDGNIKKAAWEMGRFSADYGLGNLVKLVVKMGPAKYLIKKSKEVLTSYYNSGVVELEEISKNTYIARLRDFLGIEKVIEYRMAGWLERALEISGCKHITIDIRQSSTESDPYTEFFLSWRNE